MTKTTVSHDGARFLRAKAASAHFNIAPSTLWHWAKTRRGFPQPLKAGRRVTLFDVQAIERFLRDDTL